MILVTGSTGCLGKEVVRIGGSQCLGMDHQNLDITNPGRVYDVLRSYPINGVINCAGIVKGRQLPASEYIKVNSLAPHILAEMCADLGIRLVQVSTDCVFSGIAGPYIEYDLPDPTDLYGRSKLAGEVQGTWHLTVRTSFIGYGRQGLLNWVLHQRGNVPGYKDAIWNGVTTLQLAYILLELAKDMSLNGVVHVGGEKTTKLALLQSIVKMWQLPVEVVEVPTPEEHRVNRVLKSVRYTGIQIPSIDSMLAELYLAGVPCLQ
jgi:dTDP-4-dehydrorhamnose reductase